MPDAENQIRKNVDISAGASSEPAEGVCSMLASDLKRALREFFDHVERIVDRQGEGGSDIAILASSVVDLKDDFVWDAHGGFAPDFNVTLRSTIAALPRQALRSEKH